MPRIGYFTKVLRLLRHHNNFALALPRTITRVTRSKGTCTNLVGTKDRSES